MGAPGPYLGGYQDLVGLGRETITAGEINSDSPYMVESAWLPATSDARHDFETRLDRIFVNFWQWLKSKISKLQHGDDLQGLQA
ncbi:Hypothetical predicted protein [Pelobates cultripes]|uniref:Uncharacterized protein n=1 Tax=Pelobates cultripes TaxID=61616 RepID=A0AAD1W9Z7_PELCU|nr:Hypothetical predicted protein [Pelobates cultripes]